MPFLNLDQKSFSFADINAKILTQWMQEHHGARTPKFSPFKNHRGRLANRVSHRLTSGFPQTNQTCRGLFSINMVAHPLIFGVITAGTRQRLDNRVSRRLTSGFPRTNKLVGGLFWLKHGGGSLVFVL